MMDLTDLKTVTLVILILIVPAIAPAQVDPCGQDFVKIEHAVEVDYPGTVEAERRTLLLRSANRIRWNPVQTNPDCALPVADTMAAADAAPDAAPGAGTC